MSFIDDLNKSVGMFNQSVQGYTTQRAFERARQQVDEIKTTMDEGAAQREALNSTSQQLAQDLLQAGAPISRVQAAFQAFSPAPLPSAEEQIQKGVMFDDPALVTQGQEIQEETSKVAFNQKRKLALEGLRKQQTVVTKQFEKEKRQRIDLRQREFNRNARDNFKALDQASTAALALKLKNPVADSAIKTMLAKASGEVGNLTEAEREMFAGSPALARRAARLSKLAALGTLPDADRKDLEELISVYQENSVRGIQSRAQMVAGQLAQTIDVSEEEALKMVLPSGVPVISARRGGVQQQQQQQQAPAAGVNNLRSYLRPVK